MNRIFTKISCFILVLLMIGGICLSASAASLCTPKHILASYDAEAGVVSIEGAYEGILQPTRVYMLTLVDAKNKMISTKNPTGAELDAGDGNIAYSFNLASSALENYTMPMKITLSCVTAGVLDPISTEVKDAAEVPVLLGDVNNDGGIDNLDASIILQYDAGLVDLSIPNEAGDTNHDDTVDNLDAVLILKYDAGLINGF